MSRQMLGGDADAGVPHRHDDLVALPLGGQPDVTALVGVLGGVVEQVREHLGQPGRVGVQVDRLGRQRDGEFVACASMSGRLVFDGALDHRRQFDPLLAELQPSPR